MTNKISLIFAILFFSLSCMVNAEANGGATAIYFVNGVWNRPEQARDGMALLKKAYKDDLENRYPGQNFEFELAYNYSEGKVRDVIEVIGQKLNEINDPEADRLIAAQYFLLYMTAEVFDDIIPSSANPLGALIEEYLAGRMNEAVNASSHIEKYQSDLQEDKRVLLIAHSQGNLFANQTISSLTGTYGSSIGMIGVASPAAVTYNDTTYYTAHDDRVINALRLIHDVLDSNLDNDPGLLNDPRDFSNHQFKESYFASGLASRPKIDEDVIGNMENLRFPSAQLTVLRFVVEWDNLPGDIYSAGGGCRFFMSLNVGTSPLLPGWEYDYDYQCEGYMEVSLLEEDVEGYIGTFDYSVDCQAETPPYEESSYFCGTPVTLTIYKNGLPYRTTTEQGIIYGSLDYP